MPTWLENHSSVRVDGAMLKLHALVERGDTLAKQCLEEAAGDWPCALWLHIANARCLNKYGVRMFDLDDVEPWRDNYESGQSPHDAVEAAIEADGSFALIEGYSGD